MNILIYLGRGGTHSAGRGTRRGIILDATETFLMFSLGVSAPRGKRGRRSEEAKRTVAS
jgi:hypothetical protein